MASPLKTEKIWFEKHRYDEAEKQYYIKLAKVIESSISPHPSNGKPLKRMKQDKKKEKVEKKKECKEQDRKEVDSRKPKKKDNKDQEMKQLIKDKGSAKSPPDVTLASEVAKCRQHIKESLECVDDIAHIAGSANVDLVNRINTLEKERSDLNKIVSDLKNLVLGLEKRVKVLEGGKATTPVIAPKKETAKKKEVEDDDDGVDLFASDSEEESEEAARVREERLAAYNAKKSKKPELIAKSNIILSVSPWDDETDMKELERCVRSVEMDGLLWGAAKLVPLAYSIHKLHISCVVEDAKVSVDLLQEKIAEFEDHIQSVDIVAFNKV